MNELLIKIGFNESDCHDLEECISPAIRTYSPNEIIMDINNSDDKIGFIVNGLAYFVSSSYDGKKNIVDIFNSEGVFGRPLAPTLTGNVYYVSAKTKCTVGYISYRKILECCHNRCSRHMKIMEYVINSYSRSAQNHIEILNKRSIREKLSCYFSILSVQSNSRQIRIPLPYSDLADYIASDRSAMMRELKKMNDDGIIHINGKKILLIKM